MNAVVWLISPQIVFSVRYAFSNKLIPYIYITVIAHIQIIF